MTAEEIIEVRVEEARQKIEQEVNSVITKIENNEKPYHQFTKTYTEVIETISRTHGKSESETVDKLCKNI